ncbi:putative interleukin-17 receptor E-like isoform X1 [Notolabrus celidotus]|uniref:putative interleukin-17 receptor E-like isoform X1 n=1 Tax=Notolabrus celidotus TaxID=1203425 RepID=UPI0014901E8A|nr:putative interleukin-17 receptor E-like isoform X1 [Notolabrus celidotus]
MVKMILFVALLMSSCCLGLNGASGLERIEKCGTKCSKGLRCKSKPDYIFHPVCQNPAEGLDTSSIFQNISLSTVMRCEGRQKCSLHLRIHTTLQLSESITGLSICTVTEGMMSNCQIISLKRASNQRQSGLQVEVEHDCTEISPNQSVKVTMETVPSYCGITWIGTHKAPGCSSKDLQRNVPECITGRLSYNVNPQRKELSVSVSDMLEDHNYHLRLCKKDFICTDTGAYALIKKEEPVKSATFPFSRPLPCLCIEGWSAVTDAPRVQVCPFKERVEELWFGINFDPLEETLSWEPPCRVSAVVGLCQKREDGLCMDLPHASQNASRAKISFTKVDPHPQLCMKFTTWSQSWTRCPFANARFQAWEFAVTRYQGHEGVEIMSQITADFSVELCAKSDESDECRITNAHTVHVEKHQAAGLNLKGEFCNTCLQAKRMGVEFAVTVIRCLDDCNKSWSLSSVISSQPSEPLTWVIVTVGVCLSGVIIITLVLHILLTAPPGKELKERHQDRGITF